MEKLVIIIKNDIIRSAYSELFEEYGFQVFPTNNGKEALEIIEKEKPKIIFADIDAYEIGGFDLLEKIKNIPIIIFAPNEKGDEKTRAIELNAKDFISMDRVSPNEVVSRVRIMIGEQKSYKVSLKEDLFNTKDLLKDFGYSSLACRFCGTDMVFNLIKDLSVGNDYYKVSFFCPKCYKK